MCVVSMIGDHFKDHLKPYQPYLPQQPTTGTPLSDYLQPLISKQEFDDLKKEVENMKKLLIKARIYDEQNNEPNCEMEEKVKFLKEIAKFVGVNLDEVFKTV